MLYMHTWSCATLFGELSLLPLPCVRCYAASAPGADIFWPWLHAYRIHIPRFHVSTLGGHLSTFYWLLAHWLCFILTNFYIFSLDYSSIRPWGVSQDTKRVRLAWMLYVPPWYFIWYCICLLPVLHLFYHSAITVNMPSVHIFIPCIHCSMQTSMWHLARHCRTPVALTPYALILCLQYEVMSIIWNVCFHLHVLCMLIHVLHSYEY